MLRYFSKILVMVSASAFVFSCKNGSRSPAPGKAQNATNDVPKFVHALGHTMDELTNTGLSELTGKLRAPTNSYDREVLDAIQRHWMEILNSEPAASPRAGEVTVDFSVHADGHVSNLRVAHTT